MTKTFTLDNNIAFTSVLEIDEICKPFTKIIADLKFNFVRIYQNNFRAMLMNTGYLGYNQIYYSTPRLYCSKAIVFIEQSKKQNEFLWHQFLQKDNFSVAREQFDIDNGFTVAEHYEQFSDLYYFGATCHNTALINFYLYNKAIFYKFILYFKDKAFSLIKSADKNKFMLLNYPPANIQANHHELLSANKLSNSLNIDKLYLTEITADLYLTKREAQCSYYLSLDMSTKAIAKILDISSRTVEQYLMQVKQKLYCQSNIELKNFINLHHLQKKLVFAL